MLEDYKLFGFDEDVLLVEHKIYEEIIAAVSHTDTEVGGIMGGYRNVVTHDFIDKGKGKYKCLYIPQTNILNRVIEDWQSEHISFLGIFHTHFYNIETLSEEDMLYINKIVCSMPSYIEYLYFPVITLPDNKMIVYKAYKSADKVMVKEVMYRLIES